jgi:glutaryl-CoA dehydrogenase
VIERAATPDFYLTESLLTAEEIDVRDRVRQFAETTLRPGAGEAWERGEFRSELLPMLGELGVVGGMVGSHGCPSLSSVAYGLTTMELARVDSSFSTFFGSHSSLAMGSIGYCASAEQKTRWLPRMATCELIAAFALTEPDFGSDASHMATNAVRDGDEYVLTGSKRWIGNGNICNPGYSAVRIDGKLSKRSSWQAEITLTDCRVPASARMPVGGFRTVAEILSRTRHNIAWAALGEAIACYEIALAHATRREQFGKPIGSFQLVQQKLVSMLSEITKAQLLSLQLGRLKDEGRATPGMTALAKSNNATMARHVAASAREILGGNGILQEFEVLRHMCDLEAVYTYEGTNDINTLVVGREITGLSAFL